LTTAVHKLEFLLVQCVLSVLLLIAVTMRTESSLSEDQAKSPWSVVMQEIQCLMFA